MTTLAWSVLAAVDNAPDAAKSAAEKAAEAAGDKDCSILNPLCNLGKVAGGVVGNTMSELTNAILESVGSAAAAVGTAWLGIPTPDLTGGGTRPANPGFQTPPQSSGVETLLGYAAWIAFAICILGLIAWGARFAWSRSGDTDREMGRLGLILGGTVLIGASGAIVIAVIPTPGASGEIPSAPVGMLQDSLGWYTAAIAILAIMFGAAKMAWEQKAQPGIDVVKAVLTLVLVSAVGLSVVSVLVLAADGFSDWILNRSLQCDVRDTSQGCFGQNVALIFAPLSASGIGIILVMIFGVIGLFITIIQVMLLLARSAMLVILAGILPFSAAATNTELGRNWFKKNVAWLLAFIAFKPAVAIIYAVGFKMLGSNKASTDNPVVAMSAGMVLLLLSIVALPALMRFVTPVVGAIGGGAAGGAAMMAAAALPSGAMQMAASGQSGGDSGGDSGGQSPSGSSGTAGGSDPSGGGGSGGGAGGGEAGGGAAGGGASGGGAAAGGAAAAAGPVGVAAAAGGASGGGSGGASGGGASGGGSGGGAAGGGAAAGGAAAAAGPVGVAAAAGQQAMSAAASGAQQVADESTGGPDGA